jgi:small conductance mechanosensitive channel
MNQYLETIMVWLAENGTRFVFRLLGALVIYVVAHVLIRIVGAVVQQGLEKSSKLKPLLKTFIAGTVTRVLWIIAAVMILAQLGVEVAPIIASLGVAGFVLGFAFQNTLSNFAAGLMLLANNPFEAGDFVECGGHAGTVRELNLMATTLHTPDNRRVTLPNSAVWGSAIVNFTALGQRRMELKFAISYGADIGKAKAVIRAVVEAEERVLKEPTAVIEVLDLGDSSVNLVVRPWAKVPDFWPVFFKLNQEIKEALDRNGIEIPFPQLVIHQPRQLTS